MKDKLNSMLTRLRANLTGEKLKQNLRKALQFIANPRLLLCFLIGLFHLLCGLGCVLRVHGLYLGILHRSLFHVLHVVPSFLHSLFLCHLDHSSSWLSSSLS